ncbi:hypothetical protein V8E53_013063 [Lactarius tabidus]
MRLPQVLNAMALLALVLNFELSSSPFNRFCLTNSLSPLPVLVHKLVVGNPRAIPSQARSCSIQHGVSPATLLLYNLQRSDPSTHHRTLQRAVAVKPAKACLGPISGRGGAFDTHQKTDVYGLTDRPIASRDERGRTRGVRGIDAPPLVIIIEAWTAGRPAYAGDALHIIIDRHGYLYCPHRGREASSSRSVALPLRENKEQGTSDSGRYITVREEDAELGYWQGGGNVSVWKRCSRRDELNKEKKRKCVGDVEGKAPRVDGARRAVAKTQGAGFLGCEVGGTPNSATPPQRTCCALLRVRRLEILTKSGECGASTWTPGGIQWERESHRTEALAMRVAWVVEYDAAGVRELGISKAGERVHALSMEDVRAKIASVVVISAKVERMSGGERRPAEGNIRGRYTRAREIEGSARYSPIE